jgi:hypothetical protein
VPCGCFGRRSVDVRAVLARNLALGVVAIAALRSAGPDPAVSLPSGTEVVPAVLAVGALLVAAATAWRTGVWFSRGRG